MAHQARDELLAYRRSFLSYILLNNQENIPPLQRLMRPGDVRYQTMFLKFYFLAEHIIKLKNSCLVQGSNQGYMIYKPALVSLGKPALFKDNLDLQKIILWKINRFYLTKVFTVNLVSTKILFYTVVPRRNYSYTCTPLRYPNRGRLAVNFLLDLDSNNLIVAVEPVEITQFL